MAGTGQILQSSMVSHYRELRTTKVVVELLTPINHGEELAFRTTILAFSVATTLTRICDYMIFRVFLLLFKYGRNSQRRIVSGKSVRPVWLW